MGPTTAAHIHNPTIPPPNYLLSSLFYIPHHKARLVSGENDGAVSVWDTSTGTRLVKFRVQWGSFCGGGVTLWTVNL